MRIVVRNNSAEGHIETEEEVSTTRDVLRMSLKTGREKEDINSFKTFLSRRSDDRWFVTRREVLIFSLSYDDSFKVKSTKDWSRRVKYKSKSSRYYRWGFSRSSLQKQTTMESTCDKFESYEEKLSELKFRMKVKIRLVREVKIWWSVVTST